jgi:hypothetical protein
MGEQHALFLWILASGAFGAVLGMGFGAMVGAITHLNGRAAGTFLGFRVARAFEEAAESELSPGKKGALIGGVDGSAFLGTVGVVIGAIVASRTPAPLEVLGPTAAAVTLLVSGGTLFGLWAYVLLRAGVRAVGPVFVGAAVGAGMGVYLGHTNGLFMGLILGVAAGTLFAFLWWFRKS